MPSKLCEPLLNSLMTKSVKKSATKWLEIECESTFKVQPTENVYKITQNLLFDFKATCCKATTNQITYLALHLMIAQKILTEKSTFLQYTMVICQSVTMSFLQSWHFATATCRQYLNHGATDFLQYIYTPTSIHVTQTFCIHNSPYYISLVSLVNNGLGFWNDSCSPDNLWCFLQKKDDTGWGHPKTPAVALVENTDNIIKNEYEIKILFLVADGWWPWWHCSQHYQHCLTGTWLDDDFDIQTVAHHQANTVVQFFCQ